MNSIYRDLIGLLACAVNGIKPDSESFRETDLTLLLRAAQAHSVAAAAAYALEQAGIRTPELQQTYSMAVRRDILFDIEEQGILALPKPLPRQKFDKAIRFLLASQNRIHELEKKNQPRLYRRQLTQLYTDARPYMEAYRKLAPNDQEHWAPALYRIYLNLNMGKQFEEIDRLMKKMKYLKS